MGRRLKQQIRLGILAGLMSGCGTFPNPHEGDGMTPHDLVDSCCEAIEVYPDPLIKLIEPKAQDANILTGSHHLRKPYLLDKPDAWAFLQRYLQPMDLVLTHDRSQLSGYLIPGYFKHSLIYLGSEAQLRAAGLWDLPALRPHHDKIRQGAVFYEATPPKVRFSPASMIFDVDAVGVFRPRLSGAQKQASVTRMMAQWDKPFDMKMDLATKDCLFCAELIDIAMPGLKLPRQHAYGRQLIAPDTIAAHALRDPSLHFVGLVAAGPAKARSLTRQDLAVLIKRHWPVGGPN